MMASLEHVDVANNRGEAIFITAACFEIGGQIGGTPERAHLGRIRDEVCVAHPCLLVVFSGIRGENLDIHITQRDVSVVVMDVLHD